MPGLESLIFTQAVDPILIENMDGIVVDLNNEAVRSYGWSREELIGKPIKTIVPPERHGQADDLLARCKAGEEVRNIEGLRQRKDETAVPVLLTLFLLKDEAGNPKQIATIAKDISELKKIEKKLRTMSKVFVDAADPSGDYQVTVL